MMFRPISSVRASRHRRTAAQVKRSGNVLNLLSLTVLAVILAVVAVKAATPRWLWGLMPIVILWNPVFPLTGIARTGVLCETGDPSRTSLTMDDRK